ncbi:peptidoglycan-associated lipoprotein Pal [Allosphingosinicella indica]|uniref:Peptidoglycan-associated lipoprotein n=1 Tax=Allosphingosinicella indica TaxID=941907 RepID=A0A1X7GA84_9SPHN|nr:peptidoglycan-associated lipoprotein Pal [Allosphingosinicella indica]SMF66700.1 peptidoglycan-associated lipoprotein [Allosphingosinicella indica]
MKTSRIQIALLATAALAMTAGCAKKAPEQLPPPPAGTDGGMDTGTDTGNVGGGIVPGSRADFLQKVTSDRILFETDSYSVDGQGRATLDSQAQWLMANPSVSVTIEGHADERGTREYNLGLGERRANAAKNYLASRGVPANRMTTVSWGKERPAAEGSNESAWAQNRRAVTVVPN